MVATTEAGHPRPAPFAPSIIQPLTAREQLTQAVLVGGFFEPRIEAASPCVTGGVYSDRPRADQSELEPCLANQETEAKGSAKARGALGYPAHATRLSAVGAADITLLPPRSRHHTEDGCGPEEN